MRKQITYNIRDIVPYINWLYFFYAWGLKPVQTEEREKLHDEALCMLNELDKRYHTYGIFGIFEANSDGDNILLGDTKLPLLRQQKPISENAPNLCLSDFVRPKSSGIKDEVGVFATTVDLALEKDFINDDYRRMLVQTLADRLAEATAEKMHLEVRRKYWGYVPDEDLSVEKLWLEAYQGIRPAVGYPSMPDQSVNFILSDLLGYKDIGIRLTENGAMKPHASVSGLMISHPSSHYFMIGKIGEDQLRDYAHRRGLPLELMRKFLAGNL